MTFQPRFVQPGLPTRVVFGRGMLAEAGAEVARSGGGRALVLTTPSQTDAAATLPQDAVAGVFPGAAMHTPVEVTEAALALFRETGATAVLSLGGGSAIGLGKALAARTGAPHVAVPTTYSGSEMTDVLGETERGRKTTRRDSALRPACVIYDADLTLGLPAGLTAASGMNAMAHAIEALYAPDRTPVVALMATAALEALAEALPRLAKTQSDADARDLALHGAWLASASVAHASLGLHHKLCHTLGGSFGMPHAQTHAVLIPHVTGFNAAAAPDLLAPVARIFGGPPGPALRAFAERIGGPLRLSDLGLAREDLPRAAALAMEKTYHNPRPFGQDEVLRLLQDAWEGHEPMV